MDIPMEGEMDEDDEDDISYSKEKLAKELKKLGITPCSNNYLQASSLFKDILMYSNIRKPEVLHKLLQALAWQVGSEVNFKELGDLIGIDSKTVSLYIELLEKTYVIFKLSSFSRNLRNEIKSSKKIYFYDNGIRNALIGDFAPLVNRKDIGALWENFVISERIKQYSYQNKKTNLYFWRTKQQQEIDLIEEDNKVIKAFEIKWSATKKVNFSKTFTDTYPSETFVIHRENFREFVMKGE
jgi:predicted AAA+ superfamily ATPase